MDLLVNHLLKNFQSITVIVAYIINIVVTFLITAFVFGLIFKVLPDARIQWKHVRVGAFYDSLFLYGRKISDQLLSWT
jgi:membrane protein